MRRAALLASLPLLAACTSTSSVPSISPIAAQASDATVLRGEDGEEIRLDANSELRFLRTDGSWTPWRSASQLWVNKEGVLIPYSVPVESLDHLAAIGLSEAEIAELRELHGADDVSEDDVLILRGDVRDLLTRYLALHPVPTGTWAFRATDGTWFENFPASDVARIARDGVLVNDGIRWSDMTAAEIKNVSGGKSLVGVAAVTAVGVAIVPLVLLTKGRIGSLPLSVGAAAIETGARVAVHLNFHGLGRRTYAASRVSSENPEPAVMRKAEEGATLWTPGFAPPLGDDAHRLFNETARRRATIRLGAAFDYGAPVAQQGAWSTSIAAMLRFTDLVDVGAGVRWVGLGSASDRILFARVGIHAELDARRRFALPLSVDLGRGGPVTFHGRINFGVRVRVVSGWWLGLHPLNPTYARYEAGARLEGMPYWSFPSMVETSFAF